MTAVVSQHADSERKDESSSASFRARDSSHLEANQETVKGGINGDGEVPQKAILSFEDLKVVTKLNRKELLKGVSGMIQGGFWAVMGQSGSGKSTLLNALALRLDRGMTTEGHVRLNGREYNAAELKLMSAYVMQDDVLNGHLTVEETLLYACRLRCPHDTTPEARKRRCDSALAAMGLEHTRHTIVGDPLKKGISGGERKRLAVALELLTEPKLLFLDEPTSGLDSVTALSLCGSLRALGKRCTVICTIHQPQARIYEMFDELILLQNGEIAYQGPADKAIAFFEQSGYPCPPLTNPADHILDSLALSRTDSSHSLVPGMLDGGEDGPRIDLKRGLDKPKIPLRAKTSWWRQFTVLLERSFKEQARKRGVMTTQIVQTIVMAILVGTAFLQIGNDQESVVKRQPVLFFVAINQGLFAALSTINSFPGERILALRERASGTYSASAYFLAKIVAEALVQLPQPIIFSCIVYWLIGLQADAAKFFIFTAFLCLCSLAATSLAVATSAICRTTDLSVTVLPMALEVCRLFGGFFLSPAIVPGYFVWLQALSYVEYTFIALSLNENNGLTLTCTSDEEVNGACPIPDGEAVLSANGMSGWTIGACAGILVAYIAVVRCIAYVAMRHIKW